MNDPREQLQAAAQEPTDLSQATDAPYSPEELEEIQARARGEEDIGRRWGKTFLAHGEEPSPSAVDPRLVLCTDLWGEPPPKAAANKLPAHPMQTEPKAWEKASQFERDKLDREWRYKLKRHMRWCMHCRAKYQQFQLRRAKVRQQHGKQLNAAAFATLSARRLVDAMRAKETQA